MQDENLTGLKCLQLIFSEFRRGVNFSAIITDELKNDYTNEPVDVLLKLAQNWTLRPEKISQIEDLNKYNGPLLALLNNNSWVVVFKANDIQTEGQENIAIFDPIVNKNLNVNLTQFKERFTGTGVIFRNLAQVDVAKQTKLFSFIAVAQHNNVAVDIREVMHEYAIGEDELSDNLFKHIASTFKFKTKRIKLKLDKLLDGEMHFPCISIKKSGKYAVCCGVKNEENGDKKIVILDPEKESSANQDKFRYITQEEYLQEFTNSFIFMKKTYKLSDENQPFSLSWFIPEFIKNRAIFFEIALMVLMITVFSLIVPLFFQIVVDKVLVNKAYNTLNVIGVAIIIAVIFNSLITYIRSYLLLFATNKIDISIATKTFTHLMRLPVDFFERVPSGVLLKHMQQTEKIRGFLSGNLFFTILDLCALVIFIPFLMLYSVTLTLIVLGFSALMAIVIACLIKPFQRRLNELYQAEGKRQSMLVESIQGIKTVKSLALEPVERKIWDDSTAYAIKSYFKVGKISMSAQSISQMLEMMMSICVIWVGAYMVINQNISIGALIAFQMLSNRVTGPLVKLVGLIHEYQQVALSVKMLGVVMNTTPEVAGGGVRNPLKGKIEFEQVAFRYRVDLPFVINDFSMEIQPGNIIGFVGRSGSGKTTLTKLLQGLYPANQGVIRIDGIDIREIDKSHLRRNIGVVLQENYFFSGSVRMNISLPKQNASLEEVIYAAKLAGADEFIQQLPQGYDTMLEENASNLSGGQKQRLAIARALLTNPPILIFDEATSALDPESEELIRKNLKAIANGRTVLIVSHRLSIVSCANQIVVIDKGKKVAQDPHSKLVNTQGIYRDFWTQQMGGAN